jgi:hypothetical protein
MPSDSPDFPIRIIETHTATNIADAPALTYELVTPYGGHVRLAESELSWGDIQWDDGWVQSQLPGSVDRDPGYNVLPLGATYCSLPGWSVDMNHQDGQWTQAGTNPSGWPVWLPTADNALAQSVYLYYKGPGATLDPSPTPTPTPTPSPTAAAATIGFGRDGVTAGRVAADGGPDPYPFSSFADFLDARTLIEVQRPDGVWLAGMRDDSLTGGTCGE